MTTQPKHPGKPRGKWQACIICECQAHVSQNKAKRRFGWCQKCIQEMKSLLALRARIRLPNTGIPT